MFGGVVGVQDCHSLFNSLGTTPGSGSLPSGVAQEAPSCPASAGKLPGGMPRCGVSGKCREGKRERMIVYIPEGRVILECRGWDSLQVREKVSY